MGTVSGTASFGEWSRFLGSHVGSGSEAAKGLGEPLKCSPASARRSHFRCGGGSWSRGASPGTAGGDGWWVSGLAPDSALQD